MKNFLSFFSVIKQPLLPICWKGYGTIPGLHPHITRLSHPQTQVTTYILKEEGKQITALYSVEAVYYYWLTFLASSLPLLVPVLSHSTSPQPSSSQPSVGWLSALSNDSRFFSVSSFSNKSSSLSSVLPSIQSLGEYQRTKSSRTQLGLAAYEHNNHITMTTASIITSCQSIPYLEGLHIRH